MNVKLCYKMKDTPPDKIKVTPTMTIREANYVFKDRIDGPDCLEAYLRYFDGWHYHIHKWLKGKPK